jgi:lambda repressor-like predicted transcriptional regulator
VTARQSREATLAVAYLKRTGCTTGEAARKYGLATSTVRRALQREGLPTAPRGRPPKPPTG